jgi:NAD+ synthase (glutamine-hydrolysing)
MNYGFFRASCATPAVTVADCDANTASIISFAQKASLNGADVVVFPELCVTSYTCADLFEQQTLLTSAVASLETLVNESVNISPLFIVGVPLLIQNTLYNTAAIIFRGALLAVVPKSFIPTYSEFYERRWFTPADGTLPATVTLSDTLRDIPFGTDIIIADATTPLFKLAVEICEDMWVPLPPSTKAALNGATVIANLSASNEIIGKASYRKLLVQSQSARITGAYLYCDAGHGESTTDMVFAGHNIIAENGAVLAESKLFTEDILYADIDLERLAHDRMHTGTFSDCSASFKKMEGVSSKNQMVRTISIDLFAQKKHAGFGTQSNNNAEELIRAVDPHPFVPEDSTERAERCQAVIELQSEGLAKRLRHIHATSAVIGLSGGLDSTLALLVTARAFKKCGIDTKGILAVTMPCFGTTDRTHDNACILSKKVGATLQEIDIRASVKQHFADIGQDESKHDITYENCQARERTQVLMDLANKTNGIVIGTGDLSELALGWCTYNGDHMSMYGVNSSIPKTLVRYLVTWFADDAKNSGAEELAAVLYDIVATPVSPELLPPDGKNISQKTEEVVGPYELHDFFLYYVLRWGFTPAKIFFLAKQAFSALKNNDTAQGVYSDEIILKWLRSFYRRFFSQQFKRSCMPDGAKVGTVNLSPRGDWRMPSDASATLWLKEVDSLQ